MLAQKDSKPSIRRSLCRGFHLAKKERIEEWTTSRKKGFFRTFLRQDLVIVLIFPLIKGVLRLLNGEPVLRALIMTLVVAGVLFVIFILIDFILWKQRESEWQQAQAKNVF